MADKLFDDAIGTVELAYIGNKAEKKDTLARTGVVWYGFGDVQSVDRRAASILLRHKAVWCKESDLESVIARLNKSIKDDEPATATAVVQAEPEKPTAEAVDEAKLEAIQNAILALDTENEEHYTKEGTPRMAAVKLNMPAGMSVTATEVASVFESLGGA